MLCLSVGGRRPQERLLGRPCLPRRPAPLPRPQHHVDGRPHTAGARGAGVTPDVPRRGEPNRAPAGFGDGAAGTPPPPLMHPSWMPLAHLWGIRVGYILHC